MDRYRIIEDKVSALDHLATPSVVLRRIVDAVQQPSPSPHAIIAHLSLDPGMVCRLYVAVAEARGGRPPFLSVREAAELLGPRLVRQIVSDAARAAGIGDGRPGKERSALVMDDEYPEYGLWGHCVASALGCEMLAKHLELLPPARAYVVGLLHDVGKLALAQSDPVTLREVWNTTVRDRLPYCEAERRLQLPPHITLGYSVATKCRLADEISLAILRHHEPHVDQRGLIDPRSSKLVDMVIVADSMARRMELGNPLDAQGSPAWGSLTRKRLGLSRSDISSLSTRLRETYAEVIKRFLGRVFDPQGIQTESVELPSPSERFVLRHG